MRGRILPIIGIALILYSCTIGGIQFVDRYTFGEDYANKRWAPWLYSLIVTFPIGVGIAVSDNPKYEQEEDEGKIRGNSK